MNVKEYEGVGILRITGEDTCPYKTHRKAEEHTESKQKSKSISKNGAMLRAWVRFQGGKEARQMIESVESNS